MTFRNDDMKSPFLQRFSRKFDVRSTAGEVGRYCDRTSQARARNQFGFVSILLSVEQFKG